MVQTKDLSNLVTVKTLHLRGSHDGRWLFLLKHASHLSQLRCVFPAFAGPDEPSLPFESYNLRSLSLLNGRVTEEDFMKLLTVTPDLRLTTPLAPQSIIRHMELVDVQSILSSPQLPNFLSLIANTVESLRLSSCGERENDYISRVLSNALPSFSHLTQLTTTARLLGALPHSLRAMTLSLAHMSIAPEIVSGTNNMSFIQARVGMIRVTILDILDRACGTSLKSLTITDATLQDFLHFSIAGSRSYGDEQEMQTQDFLWRKAALRGVLITVLNPHENNSDSE